ncbi:hypothetical protein [Microbacterium kunmingense]|uniref:hypothetical protein n=1 Tax=Microbacterium kunmingense TaxID=2915939 RepID=UPI003D733D52
MRVDLGGGRGWLEDPAARSIARIDREIGHRCQITEAGRTWEKQNEHYQRYLRNGSPIALHPDTPSVHQLGAAIDSNEAQRILSVMERHGWRRTVYRNGVLVEPWHFEYFWSLDQHRNETITLAQVGGVWTFQEEDDMGTLDNTEANYQTFAAWLQRAFKFDVRPGGKGADWRLGPTVFELLSAADDSGDIKAIAVKMTDEDRQAIAAEVAKAIVVPSGASKADVAAAIDAGLAKLVLKPAS